MGAQSTLDSKSLYKEMMDVHRSNNTPLDKLRSLSDNMVKSSDIGQMGCSLQERRTNMKIPDEVKLFLGQLFIEGRVVFLVL